MGAVSLFLAREILQTLQQFRMERDFISPQSRTHMNNNSQVSKWAKLFVPLISAALLIGCGKTPSTPSTPPPAPPSVAIHTAVITGDLSAIQQHNAAESNLNEPDATTQSTPLMNAIVFGKK
jgi:hypothetical protein